MRGIAIGMSALIRSGAVPVGTRLPPVRDLAHALGVSPATVSTAWRELRQYRVVSGRGRTGMWVSGDKPTPRPLRFAEMNRSGHGVLDLTLAVPDPALLPPLGEAMARASAVDDLNSYARAPIVPALEAAVQARWPYRPEAFLATNGGYEAVHAAIQALVMPGATLAIEDPTALRLLDIAEHSRAQIAPVACDAEGPRPDALAAALARKPSVFLFQPRTHSATGCGVSPSRWHELAVLLRGHDTLVIEDDGIGDISSRPAASLGSVLPDRTVHIRSYSKSLGPDLRVAVLSGPRPIVERIQAYRSFGAGWTSRLLQAATAWLIEDRETEDLVERARSTYAVRRRRLIAALRERGMSPADEDGLSLWLPVASEQFAVLTLAARRFAVEPGSKFLAHPGDFVRVATSRLPEDVSELADALALVSPEAALRAVSDAGPAY
ncbi:aminotransferase class I/II-fold pyridoxal phosphate-dependent enzyme [Alsobacter sp. SYSU M60028]|uniref:Aminotransferase class I/II-fold pyridoxal phosphate-dependent enzyme n=1 Tax=Alsobacter ponti TaxID=2962936 RepID=A0ABT1L7Z2_9HYPH|nr:aminotransferase class I/II-fold pyridoxal phosphate-dependent enzyme [Alsobacter ponti]MCP8937123.1 aminotransferase class I/II-fold pyridoxal phosphate-dependent enzyme [Alsobacter ponti]